DRPSVWWDAVRGGGSPRLRWSGCRAAAACLGGRLLAPAGTVPSGEQSLVARGGRGECRGGGSSAPPLARAAVRRAVRAAAGARRDLVRAAAARGAGDRLRDGDGGARYGDRALARGEPAGQRAPARRLPPGERPGGGA